MFLEWRYSKPFNKQFILFNTNCLRRCAVEIMGPAIEVSAMKSARENYKKNINHWGPTLGRIIRHTRVGEANENFHPPRLRQTIGPDGCVSIPSLRSSRERTFLSRGARDAKINSWNQVENGLFRTPCQKRYNRRMLLVQTRFCIYLISIPTYNRQVWHRNALRRGCFRSAQIGLGRRTKSANHSSRPKFGGSLGSWNEAGPGKAFEPCSVESCRVEPCRVEPCSSQENHTYCFDLSSVRRPIHHFELQKMKSMTTTKSQSP